MLKQTEEIFITIATCSKSNYSELLKTCTSLRSLTHHLFYVRFQHLLILSCYDRSNVKSVQDICNSYSDNVETKIIETEPKGISHAFNLALNLAQGYYIAFLNAGDKIECNTECLNSFKEIIKNLHSSQSSNRNIVYYFDILTSGKTQLFNRRVIYPKLLNPFHFLKMGNPINHQATLYPTKLARRYPYPEVFIGMDYSVNLNMILDGIEFHKLLGIFVEYDITGISAKMPFQRLYENFKNFNLKAFKYRFFILIFISWIILPFLMIRSLTQKVTYSLR